MSWRLARSLTQLRDEVNARWPDRDRRSDGTIGDQSHASRTSDHNPNRAGVVTAADFDEDNTNGDQQVGRALIARMVDGRDPRVKYIIYEGRIWRSYKHHDGHPPPWIPEPYTGPNAHATHLHLSVSADPNLYDDDSPWGLTDSEPEDDMKPHLEKGDEGGQVVDWMTDLVIAALKRGVDLGGIDVGGDIKNATYTGASAAAVNRYRKAAGLPESGVYDYSVLGPVRTDLAGSKAAGGVSEAQVAAAVAMHRDEGHPQHVSRGDDVTLT